MTKTPDETKKGLECCAASYADCHRECPYKPDCDGTQFLKDSLVLIQQLELQNAEQAELIEYLKSEIEEFEESADKCCYESRCNAELNKLEALCKRLMDENERLEDHFREATKKIEQLEAERDAMKEALGLMVYQYCVSGTKLDHLYMCAGETAFRVLGLEQHGDTRTLESWLFPECQDKEE